MSFRRYAVERTAAAVLVFLAVMLLIAVMYRVIPARVPPERTVSDFFHAVLVERDLGRSAVEGGGDVGERALDGFFVTASVVVGGLIAALILAAAVAALPRGLGRWIGYVLYGSLIAWIGLWLAYWIGFRLSWTPIAGYCFPFDAPDYLRDELGRGPCERDVSRWASHLILPWLTFAIALAPVYARVLRVVAVARRGDASLGPAERKRRHRIRVLAVVKHLGRDFGFGLGLALLVETVFGLPGLGELMVGAVIAFDPPTSEAVLLVATLAAFAVHLVVDLVCGALEPELRRP